MKFTQRLVILLFVWLGPTTGETLNAQHRIRLVGHDDAKQIRDVTFSPDGKLIATASDDGTVRVWEALTGKPVAKLDHDGAARGVAFSPDGKMLATNFSTPRRAGVRIWQVGSWHGTDLGN